jgi:hypothetical protein
MHCIFSSAGSNPAAGGNSGVNAVADFSPTGIFAACWNCLESSGVKTPVVCCIDRHATHYAGTPSRALTLLDLRRRQGRIAQVLYSPAATHYAGAPSHALTLLDLGGGR